MLVIAMAASSCTFEDDDDEGDDDDEWDDDVPAAWGPERTPPGAVTPSSDASSDATGGDPVDQADSGAVSVCASGVPEESAASCAWRAQGLCFEQAEPACACLGCSLDRCSLANPSAALDAPLDVVCATPSLSAPYQAPDAGPDA